MDAVIERLPAVVSRFFGMFTSMAFGLMIVVVKPVMSENSIDRNGPDLNSLQRLWPNDWSRNRAIRRYAAAP